MHLNSGASQKSARIDICPQPPTRSGPQRTASTEQTTHTRRSPARDAGASNLDISAGGGFVTPLRLPTESPQTILADDDAQRAVCRGPAFGLRKVQGQDSHRPCES